MGILARGKSREYNCTSFYTFSEIAIAVTFVLLVYNVLLFAR